MLGSRLVRSIESHAEQLTKAVVEEMRTDPRMPSYQQLAMDEDHARVLSVVGHLGDWLDSKSDSATESAYRGLGQRRFAEGVPLAEVVCALMLTERTIRRFVQAEGWMDTALDLRQQVELYTLISRFFERAVYFTVLGYESEAQLSGKMTGQRQPQKRKFAYGWGLPRSAKAV